MAHDTWTPDQQLRFDLGYLLAQSRKLKRAHPGDEPHWALAEKIIAELRARGYRIERTPHEYRRQDHP